MMFSTKAEYGIRVLVELASRDGEAPVPLAEIAEANTLPLAYLEHLVARLRKAGLVESRRGARGGYLLARPADEITMAEVVEALEGSIAPMDCFTDDPTGRVACSHEDDHGASCSTKLLWMRVHSGMVRALQQTTLAELVEFSRCGDPVQAAVAEGAVALPVVQG